MRSGKLDRPIVIQTPVITQDITGQDISTWIPFYSCYAQVMPERGSEQYVSSGLHSRKTVRFIIRYKAGILPTMRIVFDNTYYRILSVTEMTRREGTELVGEVWS
jgi:SPP1 family predicted phage head-tail adaptor